MKARADHKSTFKWLRQSAPRTDKRNSGSVFKCNNFPEGQMANTVGNNKFQLSV